MRRVRNFDLIKFKSEKADSQRYVEPNRVAHFMDPVQMLGNFFASTSFPKSSSDLCDFNWMSFCRLRISISKSAEHLTHLFRNLRYVHIYEGV